VVRKFANPSNHDRDAGGSEGPPMSVRPKAKSQIERVVAGPPIWGLCGSSVTYARVAHKQQGGRSGMDVHNLEEYETVGPPRHQTLGPTA
jgi:hypothetical protein